MVDSKFYNILEEFSDGRMIVDIMVWCISEVINGEMDTENEEYFYLGFDEEYTCEDDVLNKLSKYPDGEYVVHEYKSYTTDYHPDEGLLFDVFDSGGTWCHHYMVKDGEYTCIGSLGE